MFKSLFLLVLVLFACEEQGKEDIYEPDEIVQEMFSERECVTKDIYVSDTCSDIEVEIIKQDILDLNIIVGGEVIRYMGVKREEDREYESVIELPSDNMFICVGGVNSSLGRYIGNDVLLYVSKIEEQAEFKERSYEEEFAYVSAHEIVHFLDGRADTNEHSFEEDSVMYPTDKYCVFVYSDEDIDLILRIVNRNRMCYPE